MNLILPDREHKATLLSEIVKHDGQVEKRSELDSTPSACRSSELDSTAPPTHSQYGLSMIM